MTAPARVRQTASERDAAGDIDLAPGESILFVTSRHWVILVQRIGVPFICAVFAGLIAVYRAIGGRFFTDYASTPGEIDLANTLLALLIGGIVVTWFLGRRRKRLEFGRQVLMILAAGIIAALFWFRFQGGRLFSINRFMATPLDGINILLFIATFIFGALCVYIFIDWSNDQLVVTNQRVIIDDEVFLVRHVQDQVGIDDIQNVTASTNTYPQHWFNYGTIIIRSATAGRQMVFQGASKPIETQKRIDGELKKLRSQQSAQQFRGMVEAKVYSTKGDKGRIPLRIHEQPLPFFLRWILSCNPEVSVEKGTITWRPHWIFLVFSLLPPVSALVVVFIVLGFISRLNIIGSGWLVVSFIAVVGALVIWAAWEIEDYRNDAYILDRDKIIDVQKKPFGPEDRRTAGLGPVQNVKFKETFFSKIFGYGDVLVETAGSEGKFTFPRIPNAPLVAATINDYLAAFKKGEKERNLNDTLTLLQHYHNAQRARHEIRDPASSAPPDRPPA